MWGDRENEGTCEMEIQGSIEKVKGKDKEHFKENV